MQLKDMTDEQLAKHRAWGTYADLYMLYLMVFFAGLFNPIASVFDRSFLPLWVSLILIVAAPAAFAFHFGTALKNGRKMSRDELFADIRMRNEIRRESELFM